MTTVSRRGFYFESLFCWLSVCDDNHCFRSPTRQAEIPLEILIGAGASPDFTIRRHVLRETGTIPGCSLIFAVSASFKFSSEIGISDVFSSNSLGFGFITEPIITFSRTSAESGRVSKKDKSACNIVIPHVAL